MKIDNPVIINDSNLQAAVTQTASLGAGWHAIDRRFGQGGGVGPQGQFGDYGIAYEAPGRSTWTQFPDPGNGSVFATSYLPNGNSFDKNGNYRIDWTSVFIAADKPVKLDRTPPGQTMGAYAGLSLRFPKGPEGRRFLTGENATTTQGGGKKSQWADFSGPTAGKNDDEIKDCNHETNPPISTFLLGFKICEMGTWGPTHEFVAVWREGTESCNTGSRRKIKMKEKL